MEIELKDEYKRLREVYELPEIDELNKIFDLTDLEITETEFLLRKIRKHLSERISNLLRFIETILNPSNAPVFFFEMIKKLDNSDKEILTNISKEIGKIEIECIKLDLDYNEKKESEMILKIYEFFKKIKIPTIKIIDKFNNKNEEKDNSKKSYFG